MVQLFDYRDKESVQTVVNLILTYFQIFVMEKIPSLGNLDKNDVALRDSFLHHCFQWDIGNYHFFSSLVFITFFSFSQRDTGRDELLPKSNGQLTFSYWKVSLFIQ